MKAKIFSFIGLIVASVGASIIFAGAPAHAAGEQYTWTDENTIVGVGGAYGTFLPDLGTANRVELKRIRDNSLIYQVSGTDFETRCHFDITITIISNDPSKGTLQVNGCHDSPTAVELNKDRNVSLQNSDRGPPAIGNIDETTNCAANDDRCRAVQSCIQAGQSQEVCQEQWSQCIADNDAAECLEEVGSAENVTTCAIDGVGWILCPIANFLADTADAAYGIVATLLVVQPLLTTGTSEPLYQAWSVMRNIANVAFVIAFLVIIFSQITSIGISNYGIKRMLPRLVIAAILVNISYWICAIAVDISNILGGSLKSLFDNIGATLETPQFTGRQTDPGQGWGAVVGLVLTGTIAGIAFQYVTYAALFPILITVVAAIVTVFIVLALRQALIILLVVISPLAFVAYLLPNTESWFSKWRGFFQALLLMYPVIGLLFGASALASQIVTSSAASVEQPQRIIVQIMGAGIAVIPLLITPVFFKAISGVLERIGLNDPSKGIVDRARNAAGGFRDSQQATKNARIGAKRFEREQRVLDSSNKALGGSRSLHRRGLAKIVGLGASAANDRERKKTNAELSLEEAKRNYVADRASTDEKYAARLAGPTGDVNAVQAGALAAQKKSFQEDVTNMEALVKVRFDNPKKALDEAIQKGDKVQAVAAQNLLIRSGGSGVSQFRDSVQAAENSSNPDVQKGLSAITSELKDNIRSQHGQYVKQKGADIVNWAGSTGQTLDATTAGNLSDSDLAGQHSGSLAKSIKRGLVSGTQAGRMLTDPRISAQLDKKQKELLQDVPGLDKRPIPSQKKIDQARAAAYAEEARRNQTPPSPPPPPSQSPPPAPPAQ